MGRYKLIFGLKFEFANLYKVILYIYSLIKVSGKVAIFEFSSSNGYSSFNLLYECRRIQIKEMGDDVQSHFSYLVEIPCPHEACCEERGYETWELSATLNMCELSFFCIGLIITTCITSFQGEKCSMMLFFSRLTVIRSDTVKIMVANDSTSLIQTNTHNKMML